MNAKKPDNFSVIIPTYTGEEHIGKCFDSLLSQKGAPVEYEVVVVIDGPNDSLRRIVDRASGRFKERGIDFTIHQFEKNRGRFDARAKGAELARHKQLLFVDDRVALTDDYLDTVLKSGEKILLPNVLEAEAENGITRCLYLLRKRIYGKDKFGTSFKSFYIDAANFEKSPKGTTSLWIPKTDFVKASRAIANKGSNKSVNDDTRIFRQLIDDGRKLYKSGQAKIYYNPRSGRWKELKHLYARGPRFVDYYIHPGTRFFKPFILAIVLALACLLALVLYRESLIWIVGIAIIADLLLAAAVSEKLSDLRLFLFYPLIVAAFALGAMKGLAQAVTKT